MTNRTAYLRALAEQAHGDLMPLTERIRALADQAADGADAQRIRDELAVLDTESGTTAGRIFDYVQTGNLNKRTRRLLEDVAGFVAYNEEMAKLVQRRLDGQGITDGIDYDAYEAAKKAIVEAFGSSPE